MLKRCWVEGGEERGIRHVVTALYPVLEQTGGTQIYKPGTQALPAPAVLHSPAARSHSAGW